MKIGERILEVAVSIVVKAMDRNGDGQIDPGEVLETILPPLVAAIERALEKRRARREDRREGRADE